MVEATAHIICANYQDKVAAQHSKKHQEGGFTTVKEHMPDAHIKQHLSAERSRVGLTSVKVIIRFLLDQHQYSEQAIKSFLTILSLAKKYSYECLEAANQQALLLKQPYLKMITNLLANNKEHSTITTIAETKPTLNHHNIRGSLYYQQGVTK